MGACAPTGVVVDETPNQLKALENRLAEVESRTHQIMTIVENDRRAVYSQRYCQNKEVAKFLSEVQHQLPNACTPVAFEKALVWMRTQPVLVMKLDPVRGISSLHPARQGYLREDLLKATEIHPSTRFLVLYQPHDKSPAAEARALELATMIRGMVTVNLPVAMAPERILGPHALPCNLQSEAMLNKLYSNTLTKLSEALPGEPDNKTPQVRIWVFRTDC